MECVLELSGAAGASPNPQTEYLAFYLGDLGARALVIEHHYIDRHYMEEVALYYSRCLGAPPNFVARIHAFSAEITEERLHGLLESAARGGIQPVTQELQDAYLGFVAVRPISSVPIGRTILRPLTGDPARQFDCVNDYSVHFLGIELKVRGLAFQQQDRAVAACATTAIWSALQRLCRNEGGRAPTPSAITEAAVEHLLPDGRPFPSGGLTVAQIFDALRTLDFPAFSLTSRGRPDYFRLILNTHLRSGMPAILALFSEKLGGGHAVAAVGYRKKAGPLPRYAIRGRDYLTENLAYQKIYVHDDRNGPYARATLQKIPAKKRGLREDRLVLLIEKPKGGMETWEIYRALLPVYPKLRSSAEELHDNVAALDGLLAWAGLPAMGSLGFEISYARAGSYMHSLFPLKLDPARLERFLRTAALSRYVGIIRYSLDTVPFMDTIWDTTDTTRDETRFSGSLLGLVALDPRARPLVDQLATHMGAAAG